MCYWVISLRAAGLFRGGQKNELVIATTFSPDATAYIISRWQTQPQSVIIRTLNRTSASLEQLLDSAGGETSIWC